MKLEEAKLKIENKLMGTVDSDPKLFNAYLLIHSDKLNVHWNMAYGESANAEQPYHTASIAKAFTAMIVAKLVEEGKISYNDRISDYLSEDVMMDLHIYKGTDFSKDIRIEHLVTNSSGLPDFYEEKPSQDKPFLDKLLDDPSRFWTPQETIQWTKQNMNPRFPPGKKCHYTNTGFNLLGMIIEAVATKPYHEVLHEYIFQPLKMNHTYLSQYSDPAEQSRFLVASLTAKGNKINVEDHRSFSSIYAGGQTVSTSEDLLTYMKAVVGNQLIPKESLEKMKQWQKMWLGVDYGYGLMRVRMLPFTEKYNVWGHLGSIGSFMLYNPVMDVYIIGNFNKTGHLSKTVQFVFNTLRTLASIKTS